MYANQARKMQQPQPAVHSQSDFTAKDKLNGYIYEYLIHSGAKQSAEAFKNEILQGAPNVQVAEAPGFLQNWWMVFWDLYAAAPERRDKYDHSQEAKAFHDYGLIPNNFAGNPPPMMNGIHGAPQFQNATPSPMGMPPGPEGMMPGYFPRPMQPGPSGNSSQNSPIAGAPPRYAHPGARGAAPGNFPGVPPHMFPNDQMSRMAAQRMNSGAPRLQNFPMRAGMPPRYGSFMESPAANSPFNQNNIMHNGPMSSAPSLMSSPGPNGPPTGQELHDPRYGMMPQYGMPNDCIPHTPVSTSAGPPNGPSGIDGGPLSNLLNGEHDMKQSPASVHGIPNANGTPGGGPGSQAGHGPSSVTGGHGPASVQSQHGAPNSATGSNAGGQNPANPPVSEPAPLDFQQGGEHNGHDEQEISKIKSSLLEDFTKQDDNAQYGQHNFG